MSPSQLALRVARSSDVTWVDLGEVKGRVVRIDHCGWSVVADAPMLFRRTALTGVMPEPQTGGTLNELWDLLNVSPRYRPIVLAVLVAALIPDIPHPVVLLSGEQGSGKSTATKMLVGLLDPSPAPLRKPPRDVEQWVVAAAGSWVVALDNLSEVKDWLSDSLCRASTGDGDVRRRLYTDGDHTVFSFKRVIIINGIDLADIRDDLADRLVGVRLDNIPESARKEETALWVRWADAYPRTLGAVFDLAVKTFAAMPEVELVSPPRMADFARILAAVDAVLGTDGLAAYRDLGREMATDAVTSDFVLTAVVEEITSTWTGTAAKLLVVIDPDARHQEHPGWPTTAREMTTVMRQRAPSLRKLGWEVVELPRGGKDKSIRYRLTPPVGPNTVNEE
jgi:energy-coupling factor transporter ATP-binding protein EcfA2